MATLLCLFLGCGVDDSEKFQVSSRSYTGHEDDMDANNLVGVYPSIVGTRLDDCQTCHSGRIEDGKLAGSSCDHCHDLIVQGTGHTTTDTLNAFGLDYLKKGRSRKALKGIRKKDSDGDGFSNDEELQAQRYPGSELSMPGQTVATLLAVTLEELKSVTPHSQLMLTNTTRQQFDDYVSYKGVTIKDLLDEQDISLDGATGITVIALDGYMKSFPIEYVNRVFPQPLFYSGLGTDSLGSDCGFVTYPEKTPDGLSDASPIPGEHRLMLGYERNLSLIHI